MHQYSLIFLVAMLVAAVYFDQRAHRIPNALTFGGIVAGCAFAALGLSLEGSLTLGGAALGGAVGIALFLPFYALGKMGGGDVKLLGAVGAFLGPVGVIWAALFTLIVGGLLAFAWLLMRMNLRQMAFSVLATFSLVRIAEGPAARRLSQSTEGTLMKAKFPYAAALAIGSTVTAALLVR